NSRPMRLGVCGCHTTAGLTPASAPCTTQRMLPRSRSRRDSAASAEMAAVAPVGRRTRRQGPGPFRRLGRWMGGWAVWLGWRAALIAVAAVLLFALVNPPTTATILSESRRQPIAPRQWTPIERVAPVVARAV